MRRKKNSYGGIIILAFIIGIPVFLAMEHPLIFWLVFVPLVTFLLVRIMSWFIR